MNNSHSALKAKRLFFKFYHIIYHDEKIIIADNTNFLAFTGYTCRLSDYEIPSDNPENNDIIEKPINNENGNAVNDKNENSDNFFNNDSFLRAAWVPTVYGLNYPNISTSNSQTLKNDIDSILNKSVSLQLNALFQVRPCADAFYNSKMPMP